MSDETPQIVSYEPSDHHVAIIRLDDGKANAVSHAAIDQLHEALNRAENSAKAVVVEGRPGRFSAGFDLSMMQEGVESARGLVRAGAELAFRLYGFPVPTVMACTGHALAMGAILLMAGDVRVGTEGDYKIGLNEVSIGMPVPKFATELARDRLSKRHFTRAVSLAHVYNPMGAVDAGFLDEVGLPTDMHEVALHRARRLAGSVNPAAFRATRANARSASLEYMQAKLDDDIAEFAITT